MKIDELNTVETSVETWLEYIDYSMKSDFYQMALARAGADKAAALTLLHNYLSTFPEKERKQIESNAEEFYRLAEGFIKELSPYRYNKKGYNKEIRTAFIQKIRALLQKQKDEKGNIRYPKKYIFIRNIVKFCSSLDFIIQIHDEYKKFMFREYPQMAHER